MDFWTPSVLDLVATSDCVVVNVDQLSDLQRVTQGLLVMSCFPLGCCSIHSFLGAMEGHIQAPLVLLHPLAYPASFWFLHPAQEKVNR